MTAGRRRIARQLPAQMGGHPLLARGRRHELRPVGPRDGRDRPFQDRVRWSRGPVHRRVGPRARSARAPGLRARPAGPRLVGAPARTGIGGGGERRGVSGRPSETSRDATTDELADWDARTVEAPGGHVYQSRAWAEHRRAVGLDSRGSWSTTTADASSRSRGPGRAIGGGSAYMPRGPVAERRPIERRALPGDAADRGRARRWRPRAWTSSPPIRRSRPPSRRFGAAIAAAGLPRRSRRSSRRVTGSRCRLAATRTRTAIFDGIAKSTRQRIRGAERDGVTIVRHDVRMAAAGIRVRGSCDQTSPPRRRSIASTTCCSRRASDGSSRSVLARCSWAGGGPRTRQATSSISRLARTGRRRRPHGRSSRADPVPARRSALDRPLGRPRRDPDRTAGRAPPASLAGHPAGHPRGLRGDGPRWRGRAPVPEANLAKATRCMGCTSTSARLAVAGSS